MCLPPQIILCACCKNTENYNGFRLLGNLAWAYLQQKDYKSAEEQYRYAFFKTIHTSKATPPTILLSLRLFPFCLLLSCRKALSLEPDKNMQCNLAICLMHLNKMAEAKLLLQSVTTSCENGQIDDSFSRAFDRATQLLRELESDCSLKIVTEKNEKMYDMQKPFLLRARRNFRGTSQATIRDKLPESEIPKNSEIIHPYEILNELGGELSVPQTVYDDDNISLSGSKPKIVKSPWGSGRRTSNISQKEEECDASFSLEKTSRVLYTQPKRFIRLASKCDHGRWSYAEASSRGCSRKLLFQQEKNCENVCQPESASGLTSEENTLGDPATMNRKASVISFTIGVWRRDVLEVDDEPIKDTNSEFSLGSMTPVGDCSRLTEAAAENSDHKRSRQKRKNNVDYSQDFLASENRKTWADMVEEDDQESEDLLAHHEQGFLSLESILSPKNTPVNNSDDDDDDDDKEAGGKLFGNENRSPNTILKTPCPVKRFESLIQKLEPLVLEEGYYTQPLHAGSSSWRKVQNSLHIAMAEDILKS